MLKCLKGHKCASGTKTNEISNTLGYMKLCPDNTFQNEYAKSSCKRCPKGHYCYPQGRSQST